ncbi:ABC transporter permease subunit [bacterium]|nr:ABC transporter permease subunit [bacterium]
MSLFARHLFILARDEFGQLFSRRRAVVALGLYLLLIGLVTYSLSTLDRTLGDLFQRNGMPQSSSAQIAEQLRNTPGLATISPVLEWPLQYVFFQIFALFWMTELIAMMSCDIISRDRERGALRFLFLRTTREALYTAKFFVHLAFYAALHFFSLLLLAILVTYRTATFSWNDSVVPVITYTVALLPLISCCVSLAVFCSATSRTVVGSLVKIHFLWLPIFVLLAWQLHPVLSWRTIVGIIIPFQEYLQANLFGNLILTLMLFLIGLYFFRRSEV